MGLRFNGEGCQFGLGFTSITISIYPSSLLYLVYRGSIAEEEEEEEEEETSNY